MKYRNKMSNFNPECDADYMRAACALGAHGLGRVGSNPSVGCVVVDVAGHIIGRGWTQSGGRPHAETVALAQAGLDARGASVYVTLEPCSHHGETSPCVEALIVAGIRRVVVAIEDPDHRVSGRGLNILRAAGIEVVLGVEVARARALHRGFLYRHVLRRPMVSLKIASSANGYMRTPEGVSSQITGLASRARVHFLRAEHDAIITGIGTVLADNPRLDCRLPGMTARSPRPIVFDRSGRFSTDCMLAGREGLRVFTEVMSESESEPYFVSLSSVSPLSVLDVLASEGVSTVLVEAGPILSGAFLASGLVDQLIWVRSRQDIVGIGPPSDISALKLSEFITGASAPFAATSNKRCGNDDFMVFERVGDI